MHLGTNPSAEINPDIHKHAMTTFTYEEAVEIANALNNLHRPILQIARNRGEIRKAKKIHERIYERLVNLALSLEMLHESKEEG